MTDDEPAADTEVAASKNHGLPTWAQLALVGAAVLAVLAFILVPRLLDDDPYDVLGDDGSQARKVAHALESDMTCTAGEIGDKHAVLGCYAQNANYLTLVFVQSDAEGNVAAYTAETQPLQGELDPNEVIAVANRIAAVVTPGSDFTECSHTYERPHFCFEELASWQSDSIQPINVTGERDRLPSITRIDALLGDHGWDCTYGICRNDETSLSVFESATGLGLQYGAPLDLDNVRAALQQVLTLTGDTDQLQQWAQTLDGTVSIVIADGFVAGFVPQIGGAGLIVLDEVAGVVSATG